MTARRSSYKRIELRNAWLDRKQQATVTRQELRWQRRRAWLEKRKPRPKMKPAPEEKVFVAAPPEEKPAEEKAPESVPRALFPE